MATATERLNNAIVSLRNDLIEMRTQDVHLMKQLLNISITIQKMTSERLCQSHTTYSKHKVEGRTKRQNSDPTTGWINRNRIDSLSSSEDTEFHDDTSDYSDTDDDFVPKERFRRSSILSINPFSDDDSYESPEEGFLRTNIKLWKYTKDDDSD